MNTERFWGADVGVRRALMSPNETLSGDATPDPSYSLVEEDTLAWDTHMYFVNPIQPRVCVNEPVSQLSLGIVKGYMAPLSLKWRLGDTASTKPLGRARCSQSDAYHSTPCSLNRLLNNILA